MRKFPALRLLLLVLAAACLALTGATTASAAAGESITSYTSDLTLEQSGVLHVRETINYDFGSKRRHGIFRYLPTTQHVDKDTDRIIEIDNLEVTSPDAPTDTEVSEENGTTTIRIGDPDETVTGQHKYVLSYDVKGALNKFPDHVELYWNAIGTGFDVPIAQATVHLNAPAQITKVACFAGEQGSNLTCQTATSSGDTATYRASNLAPNEGMSIVAAVPPGSVTVEPILKERFSLAKAFALNVVSVPVLGALLLFGGGGIAWLLWSRGRDQRYVGQIPGLLPAPGQPVEVESRPLFTKPGDTVQFTPPEDVRPGEVGTLLNEQANVVDVTATIIDFAVRGYVHIQELEPQGRFDERDWHLRMLKAPGEEFRPYERALFDALFWNREEVLLSELRHNFSDYLADVQDRLYDDVVARRWFSRRPDSVRQRYVVLGIAVAIGGAVLTFLLARSTHFALIGIGVVLLGILLAVASRYMPAKTARGSAVYSQVLGFRQYIRTAEAEQLRFEEREQIFSRYLPYAIVFGETERWAKAFASLAQGPRGEAVTGLYWYTGPMGWNLFYFGASMNAFTTTTAGVISSAPVSTPAASGGSGFGGGGFSGGGFGGGGGGSW